MFTAKVYKVMVGSLSGTTEEVFAAKETIRKWNLENAERKGKLYMLTVWLSKAEDLQKVDMVVGIVGNWVENAGFIDDCIKEGNHVLLFFNSFYDPKNTIPGEHNEVYSFKVRMREKSLCIDYY